MIYFLFPLISFLFIIKCTVPIIAIIIPVAIAAKPIFTSAGLSLPNCINAKPNIIAVNVVLM